MSYDGPFPRPLVTGGTNNASYSSTNGLVKYNGTSLVSSSTALLDASNRLTNSSQPAFAAFLNTTVNNVTGNGVAYDIIFDTKTLDNTSSFSLVTGQFTAPVNGVYFFNATASLGNLAAGNTVGILQFNINSGTNFWRVAQIPLFSGTAGAVNLNGSLILLMTAGTTISANVNVVGAPQTVSVQGVVSAIFFTTFFSGLLLPT